MSRKLFGLFCVCVSAVLIATLLLRMDLDRAQFLLSQARWPWLLVALGATCCVPLGTVLRWMGVLRAQEDIQVGASLALRAVLMANVLNSFLPSKAGDAAKAFYLRRHAGLTRSIGTVVLERAVDLSVLGIMGILGYARGGATWGLAAGGMLLGATGTLFAATAFLPVQRWPLPPSIRGKLEEFTAVFRVWLRRPGAIVQTVAGSLVVWLLAGFIVCSLVSAFRSDLSWSYVYGVFPLAVLAGLVPVTISGIGTRDSAFVMLLGAHMPVEEATLVSLGYTLFAYWILSLLSLPVVAWELIGYWRQEKC